MCVQPRASPSSAMPSAGGLNAGAMKVSMQCAIASMPVAAVRSGGRPSVSSGSQIASFGTRCGEINADLAAVVENDDRARGLPRCRCRRSVGIAMTGGDAEVMRAAPPFDRGEGLSGPSCVAAHRDALGEIDGRAAADRDRCRRSLPRRYAATPCRTAASFGFGGVRRNGELGAAPSWAATRSSRPAARTPASVTSSGRSNAAGARIPGAAGRGPRNRTGLWLCR